MPNMYNPTTGEVRDVHGDNVQDTRTQGFVVVGNRPPPDQYLGKSLDELRANEPEDDDDGGGAAKSAKSK